jgi:peptide/nickel transport system substrate-binding protein
MHAGHAARAVALAAAIAVSLLVVAGAGGSDAQTPKRGGTAVMWASGYETPCITPWLEDCFTGTTFRPFSAFFSYAVLAGAFRLRPDWTYEPYLVSGADFTRKPPWALTYHIRPEARWSDGVPVSAGDFVFTQRTLRRYEAQLTEDVSEEILDRIKTVRALDAKTVRVVLRKRWASWRFDLFSTVLPRHVLQGEDYPSVWRERIENPKTGRPIGSGPFLVSSWERGRRLTLVRNPRYWGSHAAYLDKLVVRFDAASDPSQSFLKGEVDVAQALQPDTVPSLRRVPGIKRLSGPAAGLETIAIRLGAGGHPALEKKLVRQALAYGIDRQEIVRELFRETVPSQRVAESAIFPSSSPYYRPGWSRYSHRPAEARRLLEQAGCGRGADDIYVCAGERLSLRIVTTGGRPDRRRTLELVQSQLRRVGVEVVPEYASQQVLFGQIAPSGDFDLLEVAFVGRVEPADWIIVYGCGRPFNYMGYCQRLVSADLEQANLTLDAVQQARVLNRADARIANDVPVLPLYLLAYVSAFRRDLHGVAFHPIDPFWRAEDWWLDRER